MAVLVTGATGMLGARITGVLTQSGVEVLAMARSGWPATLVFKWAVARRGEFELDAD